jgi:lycopene cyclase domain-containing protein
MMEYTTLSAASIIVVIVLDRLLGTRLMQGFQFWIFVAVMFGFKTIVNGYLTWRPVVEYGEEFQLGIRLLTIPLEDYLYGFGLMGVSVVLWEAALRKRTT